MTPQQIEAMKLALEALESCTPQDTSTGHVIYAWHDEELVNGAITALKEVLKEHAMSEVQRLGQEIEPVADDIASILACRDMLDAQPVPPRRTEGKCK